MNTLAVMSPVSVRRLLAALVVAVLPWTLGDGTAKAQNIDLSTNNVDIDLSVIDDAGAGPATGPAYIIRPGGLLLPGARAPRSRLHVAVPQETGRIKLTPPGTKPKKPAKRVARKKPRPAKPTKPAAVAGKPPAPLAKSAPPPPPTPKKTVKTVEPAKPPEKAKMPEKKAPEKVAKAAKPTPAPAAKPTPPKAAPPPPPVVAAVKPKTSVAPAPKPAPEKKDLASLSPAKEPVKMGRALQVVFNPTASKLPASFKPALQALAKKLKGKGNLRLQLLAYAGGKGLSPSKARRMSLSRALSVRSFLIESGVRSTRIDVRALGSKTTEDPVNRVDVNIAER